MKTSAIILAAGENTRLKGIVPSFRKPLLLMNGRPLIQHAIDFAWLQAVTQCVIVASPHNAADLVAVTPTNRVEQIRWCLQPRPTDVLDAIRIGLRTTDYDTEYTFILCADNTFDGEWKLGGNFDCGFAARNVGWPAAQRFTRYEFKNSELKFIEASSPTVGYGCWVGPLLLHTNTLRIALESVRELSRERQSMAALIQACITPSHRITPVPMQCSDMGIPEEWTERRANE